VGGNFTKKLLKGSASSALGSALSLGTTILITRQFGAEVYTNYTIDLAILAILLIVLEIVPSNYSVYRVQEDEIWLSAVAAQVVLTALVAGALTILISFQGSVFRAYSNWVCAYACLTVLKRYADIKMQASGRMNEFFLLENVATFLRLALLSGCIFIGIGAVSAIWLSMSLATAISLFVFLYVYRADLKSIDNKFTAGSIAVLMGERGNYPKYYVGILLKRIKDNAMPFVAEQVIRSTESLAAFFLAFRGLVLASSQIRVVDSFLTNRENLSTLLRAGNSNMYVLGFAAQVICICGSALVLIASGIGSIDWQMILALSLIAHPLAWSSRARAIAYSKYLVNSINRALFGWIFTLLLVCLAFHILAIQGAIALTMSLLTAECVGYFFGYKWIQKKE
jgi:hypothetical protein